MVKLSTACSSSPLAAYQQKRLYIESQDGQVYTALTIDNKLSEIYIDPAESGSMVGQIILGRLDAILPGQFAFVDIGTGKNALMNTSRDVPLKKGQPILVQVYKDPTGNKGAYVGMELRHKGHYVILFESPRHDIGISQKISDEKERKRLKAIAMQAVPKGFGVIVRTNAKGIEAEKIISDIKALEALHGYVAAKAKHSIYPSLIYPEASAVPSQLQPMLLDMLSGDLYEIWISGLDFDSLKQAIVVIEPSLEGRIFHYCTENAHNYTENTHTLLDAKNISPQITAALKKTVQLPCGGFITIEQTEACVVIDVNSGRFTGQQDFRSTALTTNLEAAVCIAWQLALRNLSGIIIIDFMDMKHEDDKSVLLDALSTEIRKDRIKTEIIGITELGLVQLTRRRTREPLERLLTEDCRHCGGKGKVRKQGHLI